VFAGKNAHNRSQKENTQTKVEESPLLKQNQKASARRGEDLEFRARKRDRPEVMLCGSVQPGQGFSFFKRVLVTVK
jgi:hypothetical protein